MVNPASLGFKTTDELHPNTGLIGQDRALKAIQFGANIKSHDFNIFVLGPPASGKTTAVKAHLGPKAAEAPTPADWVYVHNFTMPDRPNAIRLPAGRGTELARAMVCEYGMSEMGPITFGKKEEQIFLGREIAQHRDFSEDTAIRIDQEVKRIVDQQYDRATKILTYIDQLREVDVEGFEEHAASDATPFREDEPRQRKVRTPPRQPCRVEHAGAPLASAAPTAGSAHPTAASSVVKLPFSTAIVTMS